MEGRCANDLLECNTPKRTEKSSFRKKFSERDHDVEKRYYSGKTVGGSFYATGVIAEIHPSKLKKTRLRAILPLSTSVFRSLTKKKRVTSSDEGETRQTVENVFGSLHPGD